jgi:hypothetical protein
MANEVTVQETLTYLDAFGTSGTLGTASAGVTFSPGTLGMVRETQTIGLTQTAIKLGSIAAPGWCLFQNLDPNNAIDLLTGTGGVIFCRLLAGGPPVLLYLGSGAQVPYAIAYGTPIANNLSVLITSQ